MSLGKRLVRNTSFILVSSLIEKIISVFFIAYAARVLGPEKFGILALIGTFAFVFSFLTDFGIAPMAIREIARYKEKAEEFFNNILSLRIILVLASYLLLFIVINALNYDQEIRYLIYILGLSLIFSTFTSSFRILYVAYEKMFIPSVITVLNSLLTTMASIVILYMGYGLIGIVLVQLVVSIFVSIISGFWIRREFFRYKFSFQLSAWKTILKDSFPFALLFFFQQNSRHISILLLSKIQGPIPSIAAVGYFNPAASVSRLPMIIAKSLRQSVLPTASANREDPEVIRKIVDSSGKYMLIFATMPLIIATTFFSEEIILLVFGDAYRLSAPALTILGWAVGIQVFTTAVSVSISASLAINRFIRWGAFLTVVNILLAVPLIMHYSFIGAAIAVLISMVLGTAVRFYFLYSVWNIRIQDLTESRKTLIPVVLILAACWFLSSMNLSALYLLICVVVLYVTILLYFKVLDIEERTFLKNAVAIRFPVLKNLRARGKL